MKKKKKGFTLVEVIVVLVIMGVLLAIAVPSILGYVKKAQNQTFVAFSHNVYLQAQTTVLEADVNHNLTTDSNANDLHYRLLDNLEETVCNGLEVDAVYLYFDNLNEYGKLDMSKEHHVLTQVIVQYFNEDGEPEKYALIKKNRFIKIYDTWSELTDDL